MMYRSSYVVGTNPPPSPPRRLPSPRLPQAVIHPAVPSLLAGLPLTSLFPRPHPKDPRYTCLEGMRADRMEAEGRGGGVEELGRDGRGGKVKRRDANGGEAEGRSGQGRRGVERGDERRNDRGWERRMLLREPHEEGRVHVRRGEVGGEGLFSSRTLQPGEVVAFFGGVLVERGQRGEHHAQKEGEGREEEGGVRPEGEDDELAGEEEEARLAAGLPWGVDPDWGVPVPRGWVWLPPPLRSLTTYSASLGHKANYAGYRSNTALKPFDHPYLGEVQCLVVTSSSPLPPETELTLDGGHLVPLPPSTRPSWLRDLLAQRTEEGYYAHLQFTPPSTLLTVPSPLGYRVRSEAHGPWRVLWFDRVEQGMTFHEEGGGLVGGVVGFDYQRTLVAAALASGASSFLLVGLGAGERGSPVVLNSPPSQVWAKWSPSSQVVAK